MGPIILFDGACNLCEGSVQFVIRHDSQARFRFAALQSAAGRRLRAEFAISADSVVLIDAGHAYVESEAALRIAASLGAPWNWLAIGRLVPLRLRDGIYRWVARHRHQWFGTPDACWLPTADLARRFLE